MRLLLKSGTIDSLIVYGVQVVSVRDCPVAETWRRVWGERKHFFADQVTFFPKISDDIFLDIEIFKILRFFTVLNVVHDAFFTRKTTIQKRIP